MVVACSANTTSRFCLGCKLQVVGEGQVQVVWRAENYMSYSEMRNDTPFSAMLYDNKLVSTIGYLLRLKKKGRRGIRIFLNCFMSTL